MPRLLASTAIADSEFDKKATNFLAVLLNQYLYPTISLHKGKPKSFFGWSLLSPDSNGILLLFPCHPSSWTNNGCGPPSPGRGTSTCTGIDHLVSGLMSVTWALFILNSSYHEGTVSSCFRYGFSPSEINLATAINSLGRVSGRTTRHWITKLVPEISNFHFEWLYLFHALPAYDHLVSGAFHPLLRVLFNFPSRY